jgi:glycosyltransferase involved in cell wall biosynthesis
LAVIFWDCTDILDYASRGRPFTGVQRVGIELAKALLDMPGVRLVRFSLDLHDNTVRLVEEAEFAVAVENPRPAPQPFAKLRRTFRRAAKKIFHRTPRLSSQIVASTHPGSRAWVVCPRLKSTTQNLRIIASAFSGLPGKSKLAVVIHDMRPIEMPETSSRAVRDGYPLAFGYACSNADVILSVSDSTTKAIARARPDALGKIKRLRLGASPIPVRLPTQTRFSGEYIVYVSSLGAHKNHAFAARAWHSAFAAAPASAPLLVFVGHSTVAAESAVRGGLSEPRMQDRLIFVRDADDGEMAGIVKNALFFIFPSLYEGWGLPVTEALSLGKFGIASRTTSLPEAGGAFLHYCEAEDMAEWSAVLRLYIADRALLADKQRRVVEAFVAPTWRGAASDLVAAFEDGAR